MFQTGILVQKNLLNLCSSAVNSERFLCSQKAGMKFFVLKLSGIQRSLGQLRPQQQKL